MNQKFYHYLDLPPPPFTPCEIVTDEVLFRRKIPEDLHFTILQLDGSRQNITTYSRIKAKDRATQWVLDTLPELDGHLREVGIQTHENSNKKNGLLSEFPTHTDGKRGRHVLCYLYDTGGPSPDTVWWQEQDSPVFREPGIFNEINPEHHDRLIGTPKLHKLDHHSLIELQRTSFKKDAWNLIRADVLHSLHGVEDLRVGLTIGFSNDHVYNMLVDKYGIL